MPFDRTAPSRQETVVGMLILLALGGIASGVFYTQSRFDPALMAPVVPVEGSIASPSAAVPETSFLEEILGEGMRPLSPPERFGPETLSEKIDGKAELYLSAGFIGLRCQRFVRADEPSSWMEVFLYDMGSKRNAFSVYSSQRRPDARDASFLPFAYHSQNAVFFVHGPYYVEIIASHEEMLQAMLDYGRKLVRSKPVQNDGAVNELALFPTAGLDAGSIRLLSSDVFGFDELDQVFVGSYTRNGTPMTAFISLRKDENEAAALASSYHRFLLQNGGIDEESTGPIPGLRVVSLLDTVELVFVRGRALAGVHEADQREPALGLALELNERLRELSP